MLSQRRRVAVPRQHGRLAILDHQRFDQPHGLVGISIQRNDGHIGRRLLDDIAKNGKADDQATKDAKQRLTDKKNALANEVDNLEKVFKKK